MGKKISALTALTTPAVGDLLPIIDISETAASDKNKYITVANLLSIENMFDRTGELLYPHTPGDVLLIEKLTSDTNKLRISYFAKHTTDGDMADSFGTGMSFSIQDVAGVDNELGQIGFVRNGGDNTSAFVINIATTGTQNERWRLDNNGVEGINGLYRKQSSESVADDGTINLPTGVSGICETWTEAEHMKAYVAADGTVTLLYYTANCVATNTDTKFCLYDGGSGAVIANRLGSTKTVRYIFNYS